jgi:hypothetical protein
MRVLLGSVVITLVLEGFAAALSPEDRCTAGKFVATGRRAASWLACDADGRIDGTLDFDCLARSRVRFQTSFARAEAAASCPGDFDLVAERIDFCALGISTAVGNPALGPRCTAAKVRAGGRYFLGWLRCHGRTLANPSLFGACAARKQAGLERSFARADPTGTCGGDAVAVRSVVDGCGGVAVSMLTATTTTSTTVHATSTTTFPSTCAHDPCQVGGPLDVGCGACVATVCNLLPSCCFTAWDFACVEAVATVCPVCF